MGPSVLDPSANHDEMSSVPGSKLNSQDFPILHARQDIISFIYVWPQRFIVNQCPKFLVR